MTRRILVWGGALAVWGAVVIAVVLGGYALTLPDIEAAARTSRRPAVTVTGHNDTTLATYGAITGDVLTVDDVPLALVQAILSTEDRRFYSHHGLDFKGIARAMLANIRAGRIVQGGSTLTQQTAKTLFLTPERTLSRKIRELLLAFWLETEFTKDQILSLYMNRVYLGGGTYGMDAAARLYFGHSARRLSRYEAAVLAGLLKAPSRYNPRHDPEAAHVRAAEVLENMAEAGYITRREAENALPGSPPPMVKTGSSENRYFADWVISRLDSYIGRMHSDVQANTTLDAELQDFAARMVSRYLDRYGEKHDIGQAAAVILSPNGAVRAMVGGKAYAESQFNRVTQARRQPGSAFKPFVYLAALQAGFLPSDLAMDEPLTVEDWTPRNASGSYEGAVPLDYALSRSLNTVPVYLLEQVGRKKVRRLVRRLGVVEEMSTHPSFALGVNEVRLLDLTAAFAPFATGGKGIWPFGIREIQSKSGARLYRRQGGGPGEVISPRHARQMRTMLRKVVTEGTGKVVDLPFFAAGKTGTTKSNRDAWFIGFTDRALLGIWMGNDDGHPMKDISGGGLPALMFTELARRVHSAPPSP